MPKNISTNFNEFVNENVNRKRVNKDDVKSAVLECLNKSDKKLNISDIAKITGHKPDNVYVAVVELDEVKSKKCGESLYWYINENQSDPMKKIEIKTSKPVDPIFLKNWEDDVKNNPSNRKIFLTMEEHREYVQKQNGNKVVPSKKRKTATKTRPRAVKRGKS